MRSGCPAITSPSSSRCGSSCSPPRRCTASWTARSWDQWLQEGRQALPADDPYIKIVLNGRQPEEVARELISGTTLADPAARARR